MSFLRNEGADAAGTPNMLAGRIDRAIGFGVSQSGRFLRTSSIKGSTPTRPGVVFDGLMPHLAGGKRTFSNFRFAQPGRSSYQHASTVFPARFPFSFIVVSDAAPGASTAS